MCFILTPKMKPAINPTQASAQEGLGGGLGRELLYLRRKLRFHRWKLHLHRWKRLGEPRLGDLIYLRFDALCSFPEDKRS